MPSKPPKKYDSDNELAQWAGGYVNAEGSIGTKPKKESECNIGYTFSSEIKCAANAPTTAEMAGLVDGEGSITVRGTTNPNSIINYRIRQAFSIEMATKYDIERFATWIRSIAINPKTTENEVDEESHQTKYIVYVSSRKDFQKVLEELFPYLSKAKGVQAYISLKELIPRLENKVHCNKRGFIETMSCVRLQRSFKGSRSTDTKYTFDYFNEEEWPNVNPRQSRMAPPKEKFEEQLFGEEERETFEDKTGPSPRSPSDDYNAEEEDPFDF